VLQRRKASCALKRWRQPGLGQADWFSGMNFPQTPIAWLLPPGWGEDLVIGGGTRPVTYLTHRIRVVEEVIIIFFFRAELVS